jgi:hypothetical protein
LEDFEWKMLVYFMVIWYILWPFDNVVVIWYIFHRFGIFWQEKSGNSEPQCFCLYQKFSETEVMNLWGVPHFYGQLSTTGNEYFAAEKNYLTIKNRATVFFTTYSSNWNTHKLELAQNTMFNCKHCNYYDTTRNTIKDRASKKGFCIISGFVNFLTLPSILFQLKSHYIYM